MSTTLKRRILRDTARAALPPALPVGMRIEDLWDETSILYRVRVGIMTILPDYAPIRFSAAFSEKSARDFSQLPRD
jgi:hypothetical protein